jgi:hypothetical protein
MCQKLWQNERLQLKITTSSAKMITNTLHAMINTNESSCVFKVARYLSFYQIDFAKFVFTLQENIAVEENNRKMRVKSHLFYQTSQSNMYTLISTGNSLLEVLLLITF